MEEDCLNSEYWHKACHVFRLSGSEDSPGAYFIHDKRSSLVYIGLPNRFDAAGQGIICSESEFTDRMETASSVAALAQMRAQLGADAPYVVLVSPDKDRVFRDDRVPLIVYVQPCLELVFSPAQAGGAVNFAADKRSQDFGRWLLDSCAGTILPLIPIGVRESIPFPAAAQNWTSGDSDEVFLEKLTKAINLLRDYPEGKMTLTRPYERRLSGRGRPFELCMTHASDNGDYACSHFVCLSAGVYSLGCTPENVFSIRDDLLSVDVVAGSCMPSQDAEHVQRELVASPKQVREHLTSLNNRASRYERYCEPESLSTVSERQVKRLRNIFHMHSVIAGRVRSSVAFLDILGAAFPLLSARPKELLQPYEEFDRTPHRYYGGVVGRAYQSSSDCFLNLRGALIINQELHAKAGVGLISESDPLNELTETQSKMWGLMEAVTEWETRASKDETK